MKRDHHQEEDEDYNEEFNVVASKKEDDQEEEFVPQKKTKSSRPKRNAKASAATSQQLSAVDVARRLERQVLEELFVAETSRRPELLAEAIMLLPERMRLKRPPPIVVEDGVKPVFVTSENAGLGVLTGARLFLLLVLLAQ